MSTFVEYRLPLPLPSVGDGFEQATLDLKVKAELTKSFHLAKDVAAFANHLGGVLILGASETNGRVGAYVPMSETDANATQDAFSKAVAQRCSPRPVIDFGRYPVAPGFVLTVLVWPFVGQPVGVKVKADSAVGGYGGDAYAFPVRSGSDSLFLLPEQLPMYMIPEQRRIAIALSQVPTGAEIRLHTITANGPGAPFAVNYGSFDLLANVLTFRLNRSNRAAVIVSVPLDAVRSAWKTATGWHIALKGTVLGDDVFHWIQ
jgi:Putative DNA-binding domain